MERTEWRGQVSAVDRYETIRQMSSASVTDAVAAEQQAFREASSKEEYLQKCQAARSNGTEPDSSSYSVASQDGVTSEVYRSSDVALKVIISHQVLEPHNPRREIAILQGLQPPCIPLQEAFRDEEQRLVLAFPFMPYSLAGLLESGPLEMAQVRRIFQDVFDALKDIHARGIIHRDLKPSAVLLRSRDGPAYLSDFGTAWHPELSAQSEPRDDKILDIGTGPYRAPEVLFGNKSYGPPVDMWAAGVMLAEAATDPPVPLFESRAVHEDGNQLGLILSIFKTLGTPNKDNWPEALEFKVSPFELWTVFPPQPWTTLLTDVDDATRDLVATLVRFDGTRATAEQALRHPALCS